MALNSENTILPFAVQLAQHGISLKRAPAKILQINLGKLCNQTCSHCHVDAGPNKKRENMTTATAQRILELAENSPSVTTIDLTGGAPELNENFRSIVQHFFERKMTIIDRCNLTVLLEPGQEDTADFFANHKVQVVASLPCYSSANVERQRGDGVFAKSIRGLQLLNEVGYGRQGSGLMLDLVYNPVGPHLPPAQSQLQSDYKHRLQADFGIEFNRLFTITNMPIKRFLADLRRQGKEQQYMELLVNSFSSAAAEKVMCRDLISVSWDGRIFDCDFNQMLDLPISSGFSIHSISSFSEMESQAITLANHCYGCTAGAGSSCSGSLT